MLHDSLSSHAVLAPACDIDYHVVPCHLRDGVGCRPVIHVRRGQRRTRVVEYVPFRLHHLLHLKNHPPATVAI